jgi:hypothetical protein
LISVKVNGETLRERLRRDIHDFRASAKGAPQGGCVGARYWQTIRSEFAQAMNPLLSTKPPLETAQDTNNARRSANPLESYLASCSDLNPREAMGCLRTVVASMVMSNAAKQTVIMG